jgi:signal transduction histidine kinase
MDQSEFEQDVDFGAVIRLDLVLYEEIIQSFVDLYRVSVKVIDNSGELLLDFNAVNDLCRWIHGIAPCRSACTSLIGSIRRDTPDFKGHDDKVCFSGAEYRIVPIHRDTDVIGKIIFGPFLPSSLTAPPPSFLAMDELVDSQTAWKHLTRFRRLHPGLALKVAQNIAIVFECVSFIGFKGRMTTTMHVASISEAYRELEEKNATLERTVDQLRALNDKRSNMLAAVSAELISPLTALIGNAEMLVEGVGGELNVDQGDFVNTIIEAGEQSLTVAETMAELSGLERGTLTINPTRVPSSEVVAAALDFGQRFGTRSEVHVQLEPWDGTLPDLYAERDKAIGILKQLVDNAVKFTPAGGSVSLSVNVDDDFVAFKVKDTGIGIGKEHHRSIFKPFYKAHDDETGSYTGTGVGLAIVQAYVDAHRGRIRMMSKPGVGTTVVIYLPIHG